MHTNWWLVHVVSVVALWSEVSTVQVQVAAFHQPPFSVTLGGGGAASKNNHNTNIHTITSPQAVATRPYYSSSSSTTKRYNAALLVDIDESAPRDVQTMEEWATACGVQTSEGFQFTSEDGVDISVMTTEDLAANSPVVFVPAGMILSSDRAMEELGRSEAAETLLISLNEQDQLRHFYLMLKILVEYERGDESPWYPWLNSLPRYFSNGASMTPFCYTCLPPLASSLAMKERVTFINLVAAVAKTDILSDSIKYDKDICKWAFQIAYTRGFPDTDTSDVKICPMADFFNHGSIGAEIELAYDDEGNCYAQTTCDVPAGSALRMQYGDPTNPSFLLSRYGFLDETSPATFCKIMVPHKNSQLEDMGYAHNRMLFFKDTGDVSEEVWDVLLYQLLGESNMASRREFYTAHMNEDFETKQSFHEHFYPQTAAKLKDHIDTFLNQLDELSAKGDGKDINEHPRLPLILRHNEFVRNAFLAVRERYELY